MVGRKLFLVLLVLLVAGAAAADMVVITKGFFNELPPPAEICAQLTSANPGGVPITFYANSIFGVKATTATALTNSSGITCACVNWPRGVYSVQANAGILWSQFVASVVANPDELDNGVAGGGALALFHSGVFPNMSTSFTPRYATFGILQNTGIPNIAFQLLYYDHENPAGPLKFVAKSFMQTQCLGAGDVKRYVGNGVLTIGANPPKSVRYIAEAVDDNGGFFALELRSFANQLLYTSDAGISYEGSVINGEVEVECP